MTQKPFPARNSINGCLRGIEGSPSHKMITFWALRCREGGRNSATICCLNLVLNMCPALSLMRRISSLARAIQEDCDQRLGLMQLFALVWEDRRPPRERSLGPSQAVEGLGERLEPTKQSRQLGISISRNRLQQKEFYFPETDPMRVSTATARSDTRSVSRRSARLPVSRASARFYCPRWLAIYPEQSHKT